MHSIFRVFILIIALGVVGPAVADDDQRMVRYLLERGQIMRLEEIMAILNQRLPGNEIIKVEFDRDDGHYIYEFKIIDSYGIIREVEVDAQNGRILDIEVDD